MKASKIVVAVVVLAVVAAFVLPAVYRAGEDHGVEKIRMSSPMLVTGWDTGAGDYNRFFQGLRYEVVRVEFYDGATFTITSLKEHRVSLVAQDIKRLVENLFNRRMADVAVTIHNHPVNPDFSQADQDILGQLRRDGFQGHFLLWHRGVITDMVDKAQEL